MTEDVNAAIRGAFDGGAKEVFVTDGHAGGSNILIEELDPRASLNTGSPSPLSMVQGVDEVDGVIYVGYHARAGSPEGILDHTWSSRTVANVWLNDILVGEYGINAAVAGHFDVPVLMVTGDQTACMQTVELLGDLETVVVKHATGRYSAECLSPKVAHGMIQKAAAKAVSKLAKRKAPLNRLSWKSRSCCRSSSSTPPWPTTPCVCRMPSAMAPVSPCPCRICSRPTAPSVRWFHWLLGKSSLPAPVPQAQVSGDQRSQSKRSI